MTVTPLTTDLLPDQRSLQRLLTHCHRTVLNKGQPQFVSLALEIPPVDPLTLVAIEQETAGNGHGQVLAQERLWFFLERHAEAIAAWEPVWQFQVEGPQRFCQAKAAIQSVLTNTITAGDETLPFAGPHFFCSFSFFAHNLQPSPFAAATVFLPRWQVSRCQQISTLVANLVLHPNADPVEMADQLWDDYQQFTAPLRSGGFWSQPTCLSRPMPESGQSILPFKTAVTAALEDIRCDRLQKLVLAHAVDLVAPQAPDVRRTLARLRQRYPDCYVFSLGNGQGQTFLGASPERLIGLQAEKLVVDALAGSAPRGRTLQEDRTIANALLNSEKDLWEHQVIVDFICQCLQSLKITPQPLSPPTLLQLANIQHLQTLITAQVPDQLHLLDILPTLHPTPAVAGTPRAIACEQIQHYEPFARQLYAAPLGWINHRGEGEFIVGIRSALLRGNAIRLYAGAGIVAGSDPDREVAEIQLKLQTLLGALH